MWEEVRRKAGRNVPARSGLSPERAGEKNASPGTKGTPQRGAAGIASSRKAVVARSGQARSAPQKSLTSWPGGGRGFGRTVRGPEGGRARYVGDVWAPSGFSNARS
nr:hypothetical protein KitaXyl93_24610 [Kitasatospora sp. Xyl93]